MHMSLKQIVIAALAVGLAICAGSANLSAAPQYQPGSVREEANLRGPLDPPAQPDDQSAWLVEQDIRLAYSTHGKGRAVLVVHGGPGIPYDKPWAGLQQLEEDFRFYFYHQRGCGDSTRPVESFDGGNFFANMLALDKDLGIGAQIADIERIRRILGEEKLILIGHSYGGFLASLYAAEFPERTKALVLVAPAGLLKLPDEEVDLFARYAATLEGEEQAEFNAAFQDYMNFGDLFSSMEEQLAEKNREFGQLVLAALGEEPLAADSPMQTAGWMVQAQYLSMGMPHDFTAMLANVSAPTLIIHGEQDELTLPGSRTYEEAIPNAQLHIIKPVESARSGHFVFDDEPQAFSSALREFLEAMK